MRLQQYLEIKHFSLFLCKKINSLSYLFVACEWQVWQTILHRFILYK